jgi:hypothetical protein
VNTVVSLNDDKKVFLDRFGADFVFVGRCISRYGPLDVYRLKVKTGSVVARPAGGSKVSEVALVRTGANSWRLPDEAAVKDLLIKYVAYPNTQVMVDGRVARHSVTKSGLIEVAASGRTLTLFYSNVYHTLMIASAVISCVYFLFLIVARGPGAVRRVLADIKSVKGSATTAAESS